MLNSSDPIADLLNRIRNAARARKSQLTCPASNVKADIARVLQQEGYIAECRTQMSAEGFPELAITLRPDRMDIQTKRISKPGRRVFVDKDSIPRVLSGLGLAIISTSRGVMSNRTARKEGVGGEVLCEVW